MDSLSELIAMKRREVQWSEEDLARQASLSPRRIRALETGQETFGLEVLSRIASAFNTSVLELIAEAEDLKNYRH